MTFDIFVDPGDVQKFTEYIEGMIPRMARAELLPIMLREFEPIVEAERAALENHTKSGALMSSLQARSGSGDRPGTMSVFSRPAATVKQLKGKWGKGRRQQQGWAAALEGRGRRLVFYAVPLHQGHNIVTHTGEVVGFVDPVPFAQEAADSLGDSVAESMAEAMLEHIVGK